MQKSGTILARAAICLLCAALCSAPTIADPSSPLIATAAASETTVDEAELQKQYDAAQALYDAEKYQEAYQAFSALGKFSDSRARASDSQRKWKAARYKEAVGLYVAEQYREAKPIFEELDDYKESRSYLYKCTLTLLRMDYKQAKELFNAGEYEQAMNLFASLGTFNHSKERAQEAADMLAAEKQAAYELETYNKAIQLKEAGELEAARDAFIESGDCMDSTDQLYTVVDELLRRKAYAQAEQLTADGAYEDACVLYDALIDYADSAEKAKQTKAAWESAAYAEAVGAQATEPERAYILLRSVQSYQDSKALADLLQPDLKPAALYAAADAFAQDERYALAAIGFEACADYEDSVERAEQANHDADMLADYKRACALKQIGQGDLANSLFRGLGDYRDAEVQTVLYTGRFTAKQLRDDKTTPVSEVFTAPDGTKHRYQIYRGVRTWGEAKAFCEVLGGHLATLTTPEENEFVYRFMRDSGFLTAYFGLSDELRTGDWRWVTGEPFEYTNWHKREPSRCANERYGMFFYLHKDGTWNDSHFYENEKVKPGCSYICEWDD